MVSMNNKMMRDKRFISTAVAFLLIVLLAINTLFFVVKLISNLSYRGGYSKEEFVSYLRDEDYPLITDMVYDNEALGKNEKEHTKDFIDLAKYYEASILYNAYRNAGDEENAKEQKQLVDKYKSQIKNLYE